ncbi:uncharacterized protein AB675_1703 [Cyphellophora attinorum]|uniref:Uncharacterized protein n=1 Tax=Cyphellophora attinorum TaxID=1664694 RepID=A0A0N1H3A9_9EURO|nr:uncharacterized protein AB675_1703 [Phialophora attinorum]KPI35995.1 hypothetical protein AB675_1703 [Phialophora attinorum]
MSRNARKDPWQNQSELALLRDDFYPDKATADPFSIPGTDRRQNAVDTVSIYTFRNPFTPHAVVATANLTEAVLQHESCKDSISNTAIRSIYAMAFVKFVNGFVDRDIATSNASSMLQHEDVGVPDTPAVEASDSDETASATIKARVKGGGESSMYAFAAKIDMPEDFVDLRHTIVHGDIPSLPTLQTYNKRALAWLWVKWWQKNAQGDPAQARENEEEERMMAEEGRRKSFEAWKAYSAVLDGMKEQSVGDMHETRRQWDDIRLKQVLSGQ